MNSWLKDALRKLSGGSTKRTVAASEVLKSYNSLSAHIADCKIYRRAFTQADALGKPICICCEARDVHAAEAHFSEAYNVQPEAFAIIQRRSDWLSGIPVAVVDRKTIPLAELATRQDLQPVIFVQPPRERTLSRLLAEYEIRHVLFWQEPNYAGTISPCNYFQDAQKALEEVYGLLADAESRETFASVLRQREENSCGYLRLASYPEYEHPSCLAEPGDTLVDGGGFDGQTSLHFARRVGPSGRVYCFEPVSKNLELVRRTLESLRETPLSNVVEVVEMGVGELEESVSIAVAGGSSKIEGSGGMSAGKALEHEVIHVTSLDRFWSSSDRSKLDLISLDIEGLEMAALRGAESLIRKYRPKLQISLYHKPEDLYEIPLWIHRLNLGYKFYIGHHDSFLVETDLYATCCD